ncbi:MAG TPA: L-lactate permease [Burkholderiaceae bacterium]|nr:L-lactate permease [Burkholderiaceae bacterium]
MIYLLWALPTLVLALAVLSGRCSASIAAFLALMTAVPVALTTAPGDFAANELSVALLRGAWIGLTIAPYILGGLLFWQLAAQPTRLPSETASPLRDDLRTRRRMLFFACFLVGPFAEAATGFGVGMLGTVALLRHMNLPPARLMVFALLSQTYIPWGAMGSGTMLAAAYAKMPATALASASLVPVALLMIVWLPLFWRTAAGAGLSAPASEHLGEIGWVALCLGTLALVNAQLGPEIALIAAFGPLIVIRHLLDSRPSAAQIRQALARTWPYAALVGVLVLTRVFAPLRHALAALATIAPYPDLPAWTPLLHAGSWLIAGAVAVAFARGERGRLRQELPHTLKTAKTPVVTVFLFAMLAEVMSAAGISKAVAAGLFSSMGTLSLLAAPLISVGLGVLTNSGSAANSLFMSSQVAMATQAHLAVSVSAALQHVAGTSMSLYSPVRMAIAANLTQGLGREREVYVGLLPYAVASMVVLSCVAAWVFF